MSLNAQFYFLSPVEVVKVTVQNLQEVAEWCGGVVAQTESRRKPGTMDKYVWVPTPEGAKVSSAFPGMYVTRRLVATNKGELKVTWAVFRLDYFEANYFGAPGEAVDKTWGKKNPEIIKDKRKQPADLIPVIEEKPKEEGATIINVFVTPDGERPTEEMVAEAKAVGEGVARWEELRVENERRKQLFGGEIPKDAAL